MKPLVSVMGSSAGAIETFLMTAVDDGCHTSEKRCHRFWRVAYYNESHSPEPFAMQTAAVAATRGTRARVRKPRDPRLAPQVGDLLAKGRDRRLVQGVTERDIVFGHPDAVATRRCSLPAWQDWARAAVVEEAGHA